MRITHRTILSISMVLLLLMTFLVALFWVFPTFFPSFSFQIILLAMSSASSLINIYKYVKGYSYEELLGIMRQQTAETAVARSKRALEESKDLKELTNIINSLKNELDNYIDQASADAEER